MNKKKSKEENKQNKKIIWATIALVVVVIASCVALAFINSNSGTKYESYQSVNSDEVFSLLDETEGVTNLYIGRDTCPHCSVFAPKLIEVIKKEDILVYYYDTALARADDVDKLTELMDRLNVSSVPALLRVENGEVISRLGDYDDKEALTRFLTQ